ncbi:MAG: ABC transporter substrate-binding protein [Kiloniellales bacterium]
MIAVSIGLLIASSAEAQQGEAAKVITAFQGALLNVMRNADGLGFRGRFRALAPAVANSFDLGLMVRYIVTSRHWRRMNPQQRQRLVDAFRRYTVAIHADRFDDYNGQRFEVLAQRAVPRGAVVVQSRLVKRNGDDVRIDYLMQATNSAWRIVDVYLKGAISELAIRRSEYVSVIKRRGYDGLINAIETQTQKIANDTS